MGENLKPSPKNSATGQAAVSSASAASSSSASATPMDRAVVDQLMSLGFSEAQVTNYIVTMMTLLSVYLQVRQALQSCNGNAEMAAALLFESTQQ